MMQPQRLTKSTSSNGVISSIKKAVPCRDGFFHSRRLRLFHDFHDAAGPGINQYRSVVDDSVSIAPDPVFLRYVVIRYAGLGEHFANPDVALIAIRRTVLFDDIATETRALIDTEHAVYSANDASDGPAHNGAYGTGSPFALACATFDTPGNALRRSGERNDN
jgi:hypothetical protein